MPKNVNYVSEKVDCVFEMYQKFKDSGQYNFMASRIPVKSQLNVDALGGHDLRLLGYPAD